MISITNLWIRVDAQNSDSDFWYIDYEHCIATHSDKRPIHESTRKWNGTITEFLEQRQMQIIAKNKTEVKFKSRESG